MMPAPTYLDEAIGLLRQLISTPSFSGQEQEAIQLVDDLLTRKGVAFHAVGHNRWMVNHQFQSNKPTILLNSHIDTVQPNKGYTRDPFTATVEDGKIYGLGSNDAGASLVCLLLTYLHYYERTDLPVNLCMAISTEEENSGAGGMQQLRNELPSWDWALIGEPTSMQPAIAEKGLMVIDGLLTGTAGHAAHIKDDMAIYKLAADIRALEQLPFDKESTLLGPVKVTMTQAQAGSQHNVVPAECHYVLDVRINELYTPEAVFDILQSQLQAQLTPRSMRLRPSFIDPKHPVVQCLVDMGKQPYGSPTLSDQALLNGATFKMGPGDTTRSHQADEFIMLQELEEGLNGYRQLLDTYFQTLNTHS